MKQTQDGSQNIAANKPMFSQIFSTISSWQVSDKTQRVEQEAELQKQQQLIQDQLNYKIEEKNSLTSMANLADEFSKSAPNIQNDLIPFHQIGKGGQGCVQMFLHRATRKRIAVKQCKVFTDYQRERNVILQLRNRLGPTYKDLATELLSYSDREQKLCYACGYCSLKELQKQRVKKQQQGKNSEAVEWKEAELWFILKVIGLNIITLHKQGIYHSDIKPANIILEVNDVSYTLKLCDFGCATTDWTKIYGCTPKYYSQLRKFKDQAQRLKAEFYSLAKVLKELMGQKLLKSFKHLQWFSQYNNDENQDDENIDEDSDDFDIVVGSGKYGGKDAVGGAGKEGGSGGGAGGSPGGGGRKQDKRGGGGGMNWEKILFENSSDKEYKNYFEKCYSTELLQFIQKMERMEDFTDLEKELKLIKNFQPIEDKENLISEIQQQQFIFNLSRVKDIKQLERILDTCEQYSICQFGLNVINQLEQIMEQDSTYSNSSQNSGILQTAVVNGPSSNNIQNNIANISNFSTEIKNINEKKENEEQQQLIQQQQQQQLIIQQQQQQQKPLQKYSKQKIYFLKSLGKYEQALVLAKNIVNELLEEHGDKKNFSGLPGARDSLSQTALLAQTSLLLQQQPSINVVSSSPINNDQQQIQTPQTQQQQPLATTSSANVRSSMTSKFAPKDNQSIQSFSFNDTQQQTILVQTTGQPVQLPTLQLQSSLSSTIAQQQTPSPASGHRNSAVVGNLANNPNNSNGNNQLALAFCELGEIYSCLGKFTEAMNNYQKALQCNKQATLPPQDRADILNNLGAYYDQMGSFENALTFYKQSHEIRVQMHGDQHYAVADSLNNLGVLYQKRGQFDLAEEHFKQSMQIRLTTFGQNHEDYADSLINLGNLHKQQGAFEEALAMYKQALEIRRTIFDENHRSVADCFNNIGVILRTQGFLKEAIDYVQKAKEIRERLFGKTHLDVADCLNNLGVIYDDMGRYEKAEDLYRQALSIRKIIFGTEAHQDMADSYNNLGTVLDSLKQYEKAIIQYNKALEIRKSIFSENHQLVAQVENNIGVALHNLQRQEEALIHYTKSLQIYKNIYGEEHADVADCLNNIGVVYKQQAKFDIALGYMQKSLQIRKTLFGQNHRVVNESLRNLGLIYREKGQMDIALKYFLEIKEKTN